MTKESDEKQCAGNASVTQAPTAPAAPSGFWRDVARLSEEYRRLPEALRAASGMPTGGDHQNAAQTAQPPETIAKWVTSAAPWRDALARLVEEASDVAEGTDVRTLHRRAEEVERAVAEEIAQARAAERERCARVIDEMAALVDESPCDDYTAVADLRDAAAAIRALTD